MLKAVVFIALCVAVLARNDLKSHMSGPPGPPGPPKEPGQSSLVNPPHLRVARQVPMPSIPGGMNPAQFPSMMADMAKQGLGIASKVMDPNTWMNGMSQMTKMMPQTGK